MDNELLCLLRQFRHNNSDEFVSGFDRDGVIALVSGLRAELAECKRDAERDAERYRWLRRARMNVDVLVREDEDSVWLDMHGWDLDAYVDAALAAKEA